MVKSPQAWMWRHTGLPMSAIARRYFFGSETQSIPAGRDSTVTAVHGATRSGSAAILGAFPAAHPHARILKLRMRGSPATGNPPSLVVRKRDVTVPRDAGMGTFT